MADRGFRLTFRDDRGLPHGENLPCLTEADALAWAHAYYDTTEWVLRRWRGHG